MVKDTTCKLFIFRRRTNMENTTPYSISEPLLAVQNEFENLRV